MEILRGSLRIDYMTFNDVMLRHNGTKVTVVTKIHDSIILCKFGDHSIRGFKGDPKSPLPRSQKVEKSPLIRLLNRTTLSNARLAKEHRKIRLLIFCVSFVCVHVFSVRIQFLP